MLSLMPKQNAERRTSATFKATSTHQLMTGELMDYEQADVRLVNCQLLAHVPPSSLQSITLAERLRSRFLWLAVLVSLVSLPGIRAGRHSIL